MFSMVVEFSVYTQSTTPPLLYFAAVAMVAADPRNGVRGPNLHEVAGGPARIGTLLRVDVVIDPRHYVGEIEIGDIVRTKIIVLPGRRSRRNGIRLRIERQDLERNRIEPIGRNPVAGECRPHPAIVRVRAPGQRVIDRDQASGVIARVGKIAVALRHRGNRGNFFARIFLVLVILLPREERRRCLSLPL